MVETSEYSKRIDFSPCSKSMMTIMKGLIAILKKHPTTISKLHIDVDQAGDGATMRPRLVLMTNNDGDNDDTSWLNDTEKKTRLLSNKDHGDRDGHDDEGATESDWIDVPFQLCIRCGKHFKYTGVEFKKCPTCDGDYVELYK